MKTESVKEFHVVTRPRNTYNTLYKVKDGNEFTTSTGFKGKRLSRDTFSGMINCIVIINNKSVEISLSECVLIQ